MANDQGPLYSVVRKPAINISPVYSVVRKPTTSRDGAPAIQLRAPAVPRKASFDAAAHSNTAGYQVLVDINLHQNQRNSLFEDARYTMPPQKLSKHLGSYAVTDFHVPKGEQMPKGYLDVDPNAASEEDPAL